MSGTGARQRIAHIIQSRWWCWDRHREASTLLSEKAKLFSILIGPFPCDTKHPIILPAKSRVPRVLVWKAPRETMHSSFDYTYEGSCQFWIPPGRACVKWIISSYLFFSQIESETAEYAYVSASRFPIAAKFACLCKHRPLILKPSQVWNLYLPLPLFYFKYYFRIRRYSGNITE